MGSAEKGSPSTGQPASVSMPAQVSSGC